MKIRLHFKTPDVVEYALDELYDSRQTADDDEEDIEVDYHYPPDEDGENDDEDIIAMKNLIERYVKYGECLTVEFDSEAGSARIVPIE